MGIITNQWAKHEETLKSVDMCFACYLGVSVSIITLYSKDSLLKKKIWLI